MGEFEKIISSFGFGVNKNHNKIGQIKVRLVQERGIKNQGPTANNHERELKQRLMRNNLHRLRTHRIRNPLHERQEPIRKGLQILLLQNRLTNIYQEY